MSAFELCFTFTIGSEGGYSQDPNDPGNWTGGAIGEGSIAGTKYGISAAAYPDLDIATLTVEQAKSIYLKDQWAKIDGDTLRPPLALVLFDSAVNSGVHRATTWLQEALAVNADGIMGPETKMMLQDADANAVAKEVLARRINFLAQLSSWHQFGLGWSRRIANLAFASAQIG